MKIKKHTLTPKTFQPVSIEIEFESQRELDAFGRMFNTSFIAQKLRDKGLESSAIYKVAQEAGGNIHDVWDRF